jgi:hypothetical protein
MKYLLLIVAAWNLSFCKSIFVDVFVVDYVKFYKKKNEK